MILSLFLSFALPLLFSKLKENHTDTLKVAKRLVEQHFHEQLVDFDDHQRCHTRLD